MKNVYEQLVGAADQEKKADDDQYALHQNEKNSDNVNHKEVRLPGPVFR
jgi:hypothetical protein